MKFLTVTSKIKGLNVLRAKLNKNHDPSRDAKEVLHWLSMVLPEETYEYVRQGILMDMNGLMSIEELSQLDSNKNFRE